MDKKTVLIITPPLASPAMPSFTAAAAAGCFPGEVFKPVIYDANLDFFVNFLVSKEAMDFFRSDAFYDPGKYLSVRKKIDDVALLNSAAFSLPRTRWGCFAGTMDEGEKAIYDSFCHEKLDPVLKERRPEAVILALDSGIQNFGANVVIHHITRNFPDMKLVVVQDKTVEKDIPPDVDHVFFLQHILVFLDWINTTWELDHRTIQVEPDFSIFPLNKYLAPELVLPLNLCFFKDTFPLQDFVAKLKDTLGVKGLLFQTCCSSFERFLIKKGFPGLFFGLQMGVEELDTIYHGCAGESGLSSGMILIQFTSIGEKGPSEIKSLWPISKQNIWNHIHLTGLKDTCIKKDWLKFISLNPNIVHSYDNFNDTGPYSKPDLHDMDPFLKAYSGVKQIPGEPFWKVLSDSVHLLLYLNRHGKKNLFCLRADQHNSSLIALGSHITFHFVKPDALPPGFLDEICAMVEAGGSVDTTYVRYNLERAYLIGYAQENGIIVGNSSLKHPRDEFIQRLNTITGLEFNHFVERGYTSVRPEYRALGVGARLLEGLTKRAGSYKIFSIISEDNIATQKIAKKNKTRQIAVYYSEKAGKNLGVWMPGHMIEKNWKLKL